MPTIIAISKSATKTSISTEVYSLLHENFIYSDRELSQGYMNKKQITFVQLRKLCRKNNFNYALFFAGINHLKKIINEQNSELFGSLDRKEIIAGTRSGTVDIRAIRWIIGDLIAKKDLYKKYGNSQKLKIVKFLRNSSRSVPDQANYILETLGISRNDLLAKTTKKAAYKFLCKTLSNNNIHVSTEANNCMPQNVPKELEMSGIYIRDNFNPMIFICNEISGHPDEGMGRKIYTLVFLLTSICKGRSFAISINKENYSVDISKNKYLAKIHKITNEILMPKNYFKEGTYSNKKEILAESGRLKVTPTALLVRLKALKKLDCDYAMLKGEFSKDFEQFVSSQRKKRAQERKSGKTGGPTPKTMYKSYQGDFVNFIKTQVPANMREQLFDKHIVYGKSFIEFGDI